MPRINRRHQHVNPDRSFAGEISEFRQQQSPETAQTPPPPPSKPRPKFLSLLLQALIMAFIISLFFVFVGVAAIIFIHLCIAGGALHRRHRRHQTHHHHNRQQPISGDDDSPSGYSPDELKTLPKSRFKGSEICAICLDNLLEGEICRCLPNCKHVFHLNCVDKWLLKVSACPLCRSSVRLLNQEVKRGAAFNWEQLWAACG